MGFVLLKLHKGRDAPFGNIQLPKPILKKSVRDLLSEVRHQRCLADKSAERVYPLKSLRSKFLKATSLEVVTQPVGCLSTKYVDLRKGYKVPDHCKVVRNPLWDTAPRGAFYKAKRLGSLVTDIVTVGEGPHLARKIERLAIKIWSMTKRSFDGLCRSIRASLAQAPGRVHKFRKSPESLLRMRTLSNNPSGNRSKKSYTQYNDARRCASCASWRLSTDVEVVRESLKCKKCTRAVCAAKWLTPSCQTAL
jgi:hypothetical protein